MSGGTAIPTSPDLYTDTSAPGLTVELGPAFVLTDHFEIAISVAHSRFPVVGNGTFEAEAMTAWAFTGRFLIHLFPSSSTMRPYVALGGGPYRLNRAPERVAIVCLRENGLSHITGPCPSPILRTRNEPEVRLGIQAGLGIAIALAPPLDTFVELGATGLLSTRGELLYAPIQLGLRLVPVR